MLKAQRRHTPPCKRKEWDAGYTKCSCPVVIRGTLRDKHITVSTAKYLPPNQARNLEVARDLALLWEKTGQPVRPDFVPTPEVQVPDPEEDRRVTIAQAVTAFLDDLKVQGNKPGSIDKHINVFGGVSFVKDGQEHSRGPQNLLKFASEKGLRFITELDDVPLLREWRATWTLGGLSRYKRQSQVLQFLRFCESSRWLRPGTTGDAQKGLKKIRYRRTQTDYFTPEEYAAILRACHQYSDRPSVDKLHTVDAEASIGSRRIVAMTELMRWTGLTIGMAATLERSRLQYVEAEGLWIVNLYREKTVTSASGGWVYTPIPEETAERLLNLPGSQQCPVNATYFFWTGRGTAKSAAGNWQRSYVKLFRRLGLTKPDGTPKRCHPHMFRDTFAVEHLLGGMAIEDVSKLLGHASVKETEKSYLPWVRARQTNLNKAVLRSWAAQGKTKPGRVVQMSAR